MTTIEIMNLLFNSNGAQHISSPIQSAYARMLTHFQAFFSFQMHYILLHFAQFAFIVVVVTSAILLYFSRVSVFESYMKWVE